MSPIQTVIADADPLFRRRIRRLLSRQNDVRIVADCANGLDAVPVLKKLQPDLLLLGIETPDTDGFAVLEALRDAHVDPAVILVSASEQFAARAFEVRAIDYLVKPVRRRRLLESIERARGAQPRSRLVAHDVVPSRWRRFTIRGVGRIYFVSHAEVDWIESAGNYIRLHAGKEMHLMRMTMQALEEALDGTAFIRIHRSVMVNSERIKELMPTFSGDYVVVLRNGERLTLSRSYRAALRRIA